MTLNIWNYTRPWPERRRLIAALIEAHRPDVVSLQETRHDFRFERGRGQGEQLAADTGYQPIFGLGQVYWPFPRVDEGVTILTLHSQCKSVVHRLMRDAHDRADENQRLCLEAVIPGAAGAIHIFNTHWSLSARARERNARECTDLARQRAGDRPALLMGDLNAEPHAAAIRFLHGEAEIAGETGDWTDLWSQARPDDPGFTYASWGGVRRIDYIFGRNLPGPPRSIERLGDEAMDGHFPSDHCGLVVDLPL